MIPTLYEPFKHWSDGGGVYILSDTHFADSDCKFMDEHWITPEEQLDIINGIVHKGDTFVHLGDVGDPKYIPMIKAHKKILILGNHDAKGKYKGLFDEVYDGPLFIADKILLSHEPIPYVDFCINIHGHDHGGPHEYPYHLNLAANICNYTPVNLGKMIKDGILANIDGIHRQAINRQIDKKSEIHF